MQRPHYPCSLEAGFAPQHSRQADQQQISNRWSQRAACGQHHSCGTQQHRPVQGMPADGVGACGDQLIRRLGRWQRRKAGPETAKRLKGPKQAVCACGESQQQQAQPSPNKGKGQIGTSKLAGEGQTGSKWAVISSSCASSHHSPRRLSNQPPQLKPQSENIHSLTTNVRTLRRCTSPARACMSSQRIKPTQPKRAAVGVAVSAGIKMNAQISSTRGELRFNPNPDRPELAWISGTQGLHRSKDCNDRLGEVHGCRNDGDRRSDGGPDH